MNFSGPATFASRLSQEQSGQAPWRWLSFVINLAVVVVLYSVYELSRGLIPHNGQLAIAHADAVWSWEVNHGIFVEPSWQEFWLKQAHFWGWLHLTPRRVTAFLNTEYLYVHFLGTILFLLWLFFFRRQLFPFVRNVFFVTTGLALAIYILYPLAPPRLTPNLIYQNRHYVFIDTIQQVVNPSYQTSEIGYNPYAAMPSMHFGWALIIGCTLFATLKWWPLRVLAALYPVLMLAVIVVSGNHYLADAIGALLVVAVSTALVAGYMRLRGRLPVTGRFAALSRRRSAPGGAVSAAPDSSR